MPEKLIDMHCHVGLLGDKHPQWGKFSDWYRKQLVFKIFLLFTGVKENEVSDEKIREKTEKEISESQMDHIVCLALDPVYDEQGNRRQDLSHMWVDNDYVLDLRNQLGNKVMLGASIHPYDPKFKERVKKYVDKGAVLIKWLPSAQQINLEDDRIKENLKFLASCRDGKPLPLLLHVGGEYAIPTTNHRTTSYDFLSWSTWEDIQNFFRFGKKWHKPRIKKINENLNYGLNEGAVIIMAHCGLPYYAPKILKKIVEHSDFDAVKRYLKKYSETSEAKGRCYADVSAICTPFRKSYFDDIKKLPEESLLFGSDFPTPVFELSADAKEHWEDFKAILKGHLGRIVIPEDNKFDENYKVLSHFFPDHSMFTNFNKLIN